MNSTDWLRTLRYRWAWRRKIAPAVEQLERRNHAFIGSDGTADGDTWYKTVEPDRQNFVQLEIDDIAPALAAHWRSCDRIELVASSRDIARLVAASREKGEAGREVSSEVYAMY